jgi:hypothetical protein
MASAALLMRFRMTCSMSWGSMRQRGRSGEKSVLTLMPVFLSMTALSPRASSTVR